MKLSHWLLKQNWIGESLAGTEDKKTWKATELLKSQRLHMISATWMEGGCVQTPITAMLQWLGGIIDSQTPALLVCVIKYQNCSNVLHTSASRRYLSLSEEVLISL